MDTTQKYTQSSMTMRSLLVLAFMLCVASFVQASPGDLVWQTRILQNASSSIVQSQDGKHYFAGDLAGIFYMLDTEGNIVDQVDLGAQITSSPAVGFDNTIYVGTHGQEFYAFYPDLSIKWQKTVQGEVNTSPAVTTDGIYIGTTEGYFYGFNLDGTPKWPAIASTYIGGSPVIGLDGSVIVGNLAGELLAIDPADGTIRHRYTTGLSKGVSSVAVAGDGTLYFGDYANTLYALNSDFSFKWKYTASGKLASAPVIDVDGTVYISEFDNNRLLAITDNTNSASLKWSFTADNNIYATPAISELGTVYVADFGGKLYALTNKGGLIWTKTTEYPYAIAASPLIDATGNVIISNAIGDLIAREGDGSLAAGQWPMFSLDGQHTAYAVDTDGDGIFNFADTDDDNDGLSDLLEFQYGFNPLLDDAEIDSDSDGYSNLAELNLGTPPFENTFDHRLTTDEGSQRVQLLQDSNFNWTDQSDIFIHPNGKWVMATGLTEDGLYALFVYSRETDGTLSIYRINEVEPQVYEYRVRRRYVMSPDGKFFYEFRADVHPLSEYGSIYIFIHQFDNATGEITFDYRLGYSEPSQSVGYSASEEYGFLSPNFRPHISTDGRSLFVPFHNTYKSGIAVFKREIDTGYLKNNGTILPLLNTHIDFRSSIATSSDSRYVFIVTGNSATQGLLRIYERNGDGTIKSDPGNLYDTAPRVAGSYINNIGGVWYGAGIAEGLVDGHLLISTSVKINDQYQSQLSVFKFNPNADISKGEAILKHLQNDLIDSNYSDSPIGSAIHVNKEYRTVQLGLISLMWRDGQYQKINDVLVDGARANSPFVTTDFAKFSNDYEQLYSLDSRAGSDNGILVLNSDYAGTGTPVPSGGDLDGVNADIDNCPTVFNINQENMDGDRYGDACDSDIDGDGIANINDNCDFVSNPSQQDIDGDELGDACDSDIDGDGIPNIYDACIFIGGVFTNSTEGDWVKPQCPLDFDEDQILNEEDNCPLLNNPLQEDIDSDGLGDVCDSDSDGDGLANEIDNCPAVHNPLQANQDGDGAGDVCDLDIDGDGLANKIDNCPEVDNPLQANMDGDGAGDVCDQDIDGDLYPNIWEYENGTDPTINEFDDQGIELIAEYVEGGISSNGLTINLDNVNRVVVSPNGRFVAATSETALSLFARDAQTGELTYLSQKPLLGSYHTPVYSPDSESLYVLSVQNSVTPALGNRLRHFRLDSGGVISEQTVTYFAKSATSTSKWMGSQSRAGQLVISPDGEYLYVGGSNSGITVFERNTDGGSLTFQEQFLNGGSSFSVNGLSLSQDGSVLYSASGNTLYSFDRDASTGSFVMRSSVAMPSLQKLMSGSNTTDVLVFTSGSIQLMNRDLVTQETISSLGSVATHNAVRGLFYSYTSTWFGTNFRLFGLSDTGVETLTGPASDEPWIAALVDLASSPDGKHLYGVSQSQDRLVVMTAGYNGMGHPDQDGDGSPDIVDQFPEDASVSLDSDGDSLADSYNANCDAACQSNSSALIDMDDDNDGVADAQDAFPLNAAASIDFDGDGLADEFNASCDAACQQASGLLSDDDDDNDGYLDTEDQLPNNASEWTDADQDGLGDNADTDDDNDLLLDAWEIVHGFDPLDSSDALLDSDNDDLSNLEEQQKGSDPWLSDTDGDGVGDALDQMPRDDQEFIDTDGDGIGDNADTDDDNDGLLDAWEVANGFDPLVSNGDTAQIDTDEDGLSDLEEQAYGTDPRSSDSDNDQMPDVWEVQYVGLDPWFDDANDDLDEDLYPNIWEYENGTDPTINEFDDQGIELIAEYVEGGISSNGLTINLDNVNRVVVSPNGRFVAATSETALSLFARDAQTGELTYLSQKPLLGSYHTPVYSPDSESLYVLSVQNSVTPALGNRLRHFRLDSGGVISEQTVTYFAKSATSTSKWMGSQSRAGQLVISPDGEYLYVGGSNSGITVFERNTDGGSLTFQEQFLNGGSSFSVNGLSLSQDGSVLYSASGNTLYSFDRDASTGSFVMRSSVAMPSLQKLMSGSNTTDVLVFTSGSIQLMNRDLVTQETISSLGSVATHNAVRGLFYSYTSTWFGTNFRLFGLSDTGVETLTGPASDEPWIAALVDLASSPDGKHLYGVSQSQDRLVVMTAGYNGMGHPDQDGDGVRDIDDVFPTDSTEWDDTDGDGFGDNFADAFPAKVEASIDTDGDGMPDQFHADCNALCQESSDLIEDLDDDNDSVDDLSDLWPLLFAASLDTDADGMPDNFTEGCESICQINSGLVVDEDDDNDDLPDVWEDQYGLPSKDSSNRDSSSDGDLLTDYEEYILGTSPDNSDTDGDKMPDDWEFFYNFNPLDSADAAEDFDGDGFTNAQEYLEGTYPDDATHYPGAPGLKEWDGQTNDSVRTRPAIGSNGLTYVGSDDSFVYAFDSEGQEQYTFETSGPVRSSPAIGADGTVYIGAFDGKVYALTPELIEIWSVPFQTGGNIESSPAVGLSGTVFVGSDDGYLYAIYADGTEKWSYQTGGPIKSSPRIGLDGMIYVGSDDGKVYAINSETGGPINNYE